MPTIEFNVQRYNPETGREPRWQRFEVRTHPGMTVLEGLHQIRADQDATLSWRYSCRMGVCGSCAMVINGKPGLACNTQIQDVPASMIRLQPLSNFRILKDLAADLAPMFDKHAALNTYLVHHDSAEMDAPTREFSQTPEQLEAYLQFSHCTKCGACMAACPTLAIDRDFLGPMPLTAAHRYNADSRDEGFESRRPRLNASHSLFNCHYVAECSRVCPKGVDPARAIQMMKRDLILASLKLKRKRTAAKVLPDPGPAVKGEDVPKAPQFTVRS